MKGRSTWTNTDWRVLTAANFCPDVHDVQRKNPQTFPLEVHVCAFEFLISTTVVKDEFQWWKVSSFYFTALIWQLQSLFILRFQINTCWLVYENIMQCYRLLLHRASVIITLTGVIIHNEYFWCFKYILLLIRLYFSFSKVLDAGLLLVKYFCVAIFT